MDCTPKSSNPKSKLKGTDEKSFRNCGIFTSIRPVLQPPLKTRFQTLVNDLKETVYQSYWNKEPGTHKDTTGRLPLNVNIYETTFGKKSELNPGVASLMKFEENKMSKELKDYLYKKQNRKNEPKPQGKKEKLYNPYGSIVDCCMHIKPYDNFKIAEEIQTNFLKRNATKLGKGKTTYEFPPDSIEYPSPDKYYCGLSENFIENINERVKRQEYMAYINSLRLRLKHCYTEFGLDFNLIYCALKYYDKDGVGWIPYTIVQDVCKHFRIIFDEKIVAQFLEVAEMKKDDYVDYRKFVDLLNWQEDYPEEVNLNYYT